MAMSGRSLGRLQGVPARNVWSHESHDFTPWLHQNVDVLSDLLGMNLVLEVAERPSTSHVRAASRSRG